MRQHLGTVHARPDWVMLGIPLPNGWVRLIASQSLNRAELETFVLDPPSFFDDFVNSYIEWRYMLTAEMRDVVVIEAVDYPAAFESLFKHWTPSSGKHIAIDMGQKELET